VKRLTKSLSLAALLLLAAVPLALAHDGGEGWIGETNDLLVTEFNFLVIAFFPLFILMMSLIQWKLEKRKDARKAAAKARTADPDWGGGW
jgi:large-conductance mechanosensitive channel